MSIMKLIYRTIVFSLIVPLLLLGVLCCHFSGMARASSCCSLISSLTHNLRSTCGSPSKTQKDKHCDCSKIVGVLEHKYSTSMTVSKNSFVPGHFVLASQEAYCPTPRFFNYHSPPKAVQNSIPLYLQVSALRL